ncbi:MAG TPA: hypothetical protein VGQ41_03765 [Pyrinomonadaceae bacterium]|nr:hypothetical protein [Pyrinomonadaceae bacterium]
MQKTILTIVCLMTISGVASADTKIKSRQTSGGQTYENTSYIKGKRQRSETNNGQMITVQQCDLRRNIQIMPQAKAYIIQPYDQPSAATANTNRPTSTAGGAVTKGGVITSTVTTRDTGERKQMFGYPARHIITTMVMDSSPDACSQVKNRMEVDGWYIDAAFAFECDSQQAYVPYRPQASGGCRDRYETKQIGAAKRGLPVWEKTTMFGPNGVESFSTINEVVELSQATLDPSLFDIPAGYREVQDFASAFSAPSMASPSSTSEPSSSSSTSPSNTAAPTEAANKPAAAVGPKREGVIRLGLVAVKTGNVAEGMNASNLATAVQNTFSDKLKTSNVEVVAIEAKQLQAIEAEARQKECDYLVYATASHKKGGGGGFGSVFGSAASTVGSSIGYGGSTAAAVTANVAAATVAESVKAKDELTLDVRLEKPGASYPAFAKQYKGKAKSAGEDLVTPAVSQAAQGIIEAATKK